MKLSFRGGRNESDAPHLRPNFHLREHVPHACEVVVNRMLENENNTPSLLECMNTHEEACVLEVTEKTASEVNVNKRKLVDANMTESEIQSSDYRLLSKRIRINSPDHPDHGKIGEVCNMVIDGRLLVEMENSHKLLILKAEQTQLSRLRHAEVNLTEYRYSMRAVADTGASTHIVCHPQ